MSAGSSPARAPAAASPPRAAPGPWPWEALALAAVMILLMYSPHFADGGFNHTETGLYLGNIHAILRGKVPYREIFMQFGPLNDYLPALALKVFGPTLYTLRAYFFWAAILTVLTGWMLALRCLSTRPFWIASALILAYEVFNPRWAIYWGGLRHFWGLAVVLALVACLESPRPRRWLAAAGGLAALALLTSIEVGLFATAAACLFLMVHAWLEGLARRECLARLAALAGGWAALLLPMLVYFALKGALGEYLRIAFYEVPFNHMAKFGQKHLIALGPADYSPLSLAAWLFSANCKTYIPFVVFALGAWQVLKAGRAKAMGCWHYAALLLIAYGLPLYLVSFRQFGGPQSQSGFTAPIILGLMLLERVYLRLRHGQPRPAARLVGGLVLAAALVFLIFSQSLVYGNLAGLAREKLAGYARLGGRDPQLTPLELPEAGGVWTTPKEAAEIVPVVEFLRRHTRPGEPIIVMPEAGAYHFLADRPNPLRFSTTALAYTTSRYQEEIRAQLAREPVRIIVMRHKRSGHAKHAGKKDHQMLPAFYELVAGHYRRVASFGPVDILLHKDMSL